MAVAATEVAEVATEVAEAVATEAEAVATEEAVATAAAVVAGCGAAMIRMETSALTDEAALLKELMGIGAVEAAGTSISGLATAAIVARLLGLRGAAEAAGAATPRALSPARPSSSGHSSSWHALCKNPTHGAHPSRTSTTYACNRSWDPT